MGAAGKHYNKMIVGYEDLGVAGTPYKLGFICNFSRWQIDILCDMILFNSKTWSADTRFTRFYKILKIICNIQINVIQIAQVFKGYLLNTFDKIFQ